MSPSTLVRLRNNRPPLRSSLDGTPFCSWHWRCWSPGIDRAAGTRERRSAWRSELLAAAAIRYTLVRGDARDRCTPRQRCCCWHPGSRPSSRRSTGRRRSSALVTPCRPSSPEAAFGRDVENELVQLADGKRRFRLAAELRRIGSRHEGATGRSTPHAGRSPMRRRLGVGRSAHRGVGGHVADVSCHPFCRRGRPRCRR